MILGSDRPLVPRGLGATAPMARGAGVLRSRGRSEPGRRRPDGPVVVRSLEPGCRWSGVPATLPTGNTGQRRGLGRT
jgi:hypothetical protein